MRVFLMAGMTARILLSTLSSPALAAPHTLNQIWEQAIGDEMQGVPATQAVPGLQRARMEFKTCQEGPARHSLGGIRCCLEYRHDDIIRDLNIDYWKSSPGS